ncbi:hypothetical protein L2E82_42485, partial [Cichorium intybus]
DAQGVFHSICVHGEPSIYVPKYAQDRDFQASSTKSYVPKYAQDRDFQALQSFKHAESLKSSLGFHKPYKSCRIFFRFLFTFCSGESATAI